MTKRLFKYIGLLLVFNSLAMAAEEKVKESLQLAIDRAIGNTTVSGVLWGDAKQCTPENMAGMKLMEAWKRCPGIPGSFFEDGNMLDFFPKPIEIRSKDMQIKKLKIGEIKKTVPAEGSKTYIYDFVVDDLEVESDFIFSLINTGEEMLALNARLSQKEGKESLTLRLFMRDVNGKSHLTAVKVTGLESSLDFDFYSHRDQSLNTVLQQMPGVNFQEGTARALFGYLEPGSALRKMCDQIDFSQSINENIMQQLALLSGQFGDFLGTELKEMFGEKVEEYLNS